MEIAEFDFTQQSFRTRIAGTSYNNEDGSSRQALLAELSHGDELTLVHEPANTYDRHAVAVFNASGKQLGYVANPPRDRRLSDHLDMGGPAIAEVVNIEYDGGFVAFFCKRFRKNYRCFIRITKLNKFPWEEVAPYERESRKLEQLNFEAQQLEKTKPDSAVELYREVIDRILALDSKGIRAAAWRRARYPINRLSLLLDKQGRFQEAYDEILRYEQFNDWYGLYSTEPASIAARKRRLSKKLHLHDQETTAAGKL